MKNDPAALLLSWYDLNGRTLPWRGIRDPYPIWLSEIMLQQTRVETVREYYRRFLTLFPTVQALAQAPQEQVLKAWEGLGYYSRARNLQKAAQQITEQYNGHFPTTAADLQKLPGIGPYTSGAIASIAFHEAVPAVDGNVYRVMTRFYGIRESIDSPAVQKRIRQLVQEVMSPTRPGDYNQALMDLGSGICIPSSPRCEECPWQTQCDACAEGDMEQLPIHEKKQPQKELDVAVCLLTWQDKVLLIRRSQRLLHGLYVFVLLEEENQPEEIARLLREQGFACHLQGELGTAKHVFTHLIWNMTFYHFPLEVPPEEALLLELDGIMADRRELEALPLPTAMKAAKAAALKLPKLRKE